MIAVLGLVIGVVVGLIVAPDVPQWAFLDGIFDDKVFVVSFISNVLIAALIVYLGDQLGVGSQLSTGVVVVLGIRIFTNMAAIRRHVFRA
jgi:small basic protein